MERHNADSIVIGGVKDLLPLLLHVRVTYVNKSKHARLQGFITDGGYACACPASAGCGYHGKVLSALQFEKHAGVVSNNQNGHIFLPNGKSLYGLFHKLRKVPAEALAEKFQEFAGVPMTVPAAEASSASLEPNGVQVDSVTAEPPAPAASGDMEMTTEYEQEKARLFLLDFNLSPTSSSRGSAAEEMACSLGDCSNESASDSSILNFKWASKRRSGRRQEGTEILAPTFSGIPDKGNSSFCTDTEETRNARNTGGPPSLSIIDGVKSGSPAPTGVTPNCSKHDSTDLGLISLPSPVTSAQGPPPNFSIYSKSKLPNRRDTALHSLIFKEGGLPDNTLLTYKLKNGEALGQGYKRGTGIVCSCCNDEISPSEFEKHVGMERRRQPYHNIYTPEGLTLHDIALRLQNHVHLNSNECGNATVSSFHDYPSLTSSGCGKEPSTTSGPIVPLKRTLQERAVQTESCYFCRSGHTEFGILDPNTIFFCNQCERPCHVKCYNSRVVKQKALLEILKEYVCFRFLCCQECQSLRARIEGMEKCEEIAFLRRIRSNVCWRLLSGADASRDVKLYMSEAIKIFKDSFVESTDAHVFSDMVYGKNGEGDKDFRGMYCLVLTASTHVVSAAILKVRVKEVAELVLVATRSECRKRGYFRLLLTSIEANLRACNVSLLTVPVDPEMAQIWSEKLGFTILSDEEKKSMLESHPLVMFQDLVLVQKPLA